MEREVTQVVPCLDVETLLLQWPGLPSESPKQSFHLTALPLVSDKQSSSGRRQVN
jgi:hypothetical protein